MPAAEGGSTTLCSALEDGGDALAAADAHGDQGAAATGALEARRGP